MVKGAKIKGAAHRERELAIILRTTKGLAMYSKRYARPKNPMPELEVAYARLDARRVVLMAELRGLTDGN